MRLTFRYPAYPTKTQEATLLRWLDHLCGLQNSARHDRKVAWETEGERVSINDQQKKLKVARETYEDFREVPQDMQVCALERTDKAFDGFYSRCEKELRKRGIQDTENRLNLCHGNSVSTNSKQVNVSVKILSAKQHGNMTV